MSNRPHHHRRPSPQLDPDTLTGWGLLSAANRGCVCEPEVCRQHVGGNVWRIEVAHDHDCPALPEAKEPRR